MLSIAAILGTGLAVGCANGLIFVYGRVPHPFIVTLATLSIVRGLALWAANGTLIPGMPPIVQTIGGGSIDWIPYSIFVVIALALVCLLLTTRLVWGRWLYAVGGNPEAARRSSIPTRRVLVTVYVHQRVRRRRRRPAHRRPDRRAARRRPATSPSSTRSRP